MGNGSLDWDFESFDLVFEPLELTMLEIQEHFTGQHWQRSEVIRAHNLPLGGWGACPESLKIEAKNGKTDS